MVERDSTSIAGQAQPLEIDNLWTVDTGTGLVIRARRQSWIVTADGEDRRLVEARVRALEAAACNQRYHNTRQQSRAQLEIGRASCRERACTSVDILVVAAPLTQKETQHHHSNI